MSKKLTILLVASLSIQAGGKLYHQAPTEPTPIVSNFYIESNIGYLRIKDKTTDEKLDAPLFSIVGGYHINRFLAIEARASHTISHLDYSGNGSNTLQDSHYSHIGANIRLSYPIESLTPYLIIGYGQNRISNFRGADREESSSYIGIGADYRINSSSSIGINYIRSYDDKGFDGRATADDITIDHFNISFTYRF